MFQISFSFISILYFSVLKFPSTVLSCTTCENPGNSAYCFKYSSTAFFRKILGKKALVWLVMSGAAEFSGPGRVRLPQLHAQACSSKITWMQPYRPGFIFPFLSKAPKFSKPVEGAYRHGNRE